MGEAGLFLIERSSARTRRVPSPALTLDEQIEAIKEIKELIDVGILSLDEFDKRKKQIMGLERPLSGVKA